MPAPARTLGNWNLGPRANCEWRIPLLVALVGCSARTLPSSIAVGGRESAACANGEGLQYYAPLYLEAEATDGAAPNAIPMSADQLAEALIRLSGPASEFSSSLWRAFRTDARSGSTSRNATTPRCLGAPRRAPTVSQCGPRYNLVSIAARPAKVSDLLVHTGARTIPSCVGQPRW